MKGAMAMKKSCAWPIFGGELRRCDKLTDVGVHDSMLES